MMLWCGITFVMLEHNIDPCRWLCLLGLLGVVDKKERRQKSRGSTRGFLPPGCLLANDQEQQPSIWVIWSPSGEKGAYAPLKRDAPAWTYSLLPIALSVLSTG